MKTICLVASSVLISFFASAQVGTPKFKYHLPPANVDLAASFTQPKAKLIGQSVSGKVYAMPADNMPCLVPPAGIENSPMAVLVPLCEPGMPNAIPEQHFFTSPLVNANLLKLNQPKKEVSKNLMLDLIRKK